MVNHLNTVLVLSKLAHQADFLQEIVPNLSREVSLFLAVQTDVGLVHRNQILGAECSETLAQCVNRCTEVVERSVAVELIAASARAHVQTAAGQLFAQYVLVGGQVAVGAKLKCLVASGSGLIEEDIPGGTRGGTVCVPYAPGARSGCNRYFANSDNLL